MNSRERVLTALSHQQPDKVPLDVGGTFCTTLHVSCVAQLREYYGLKGMAKLAHPGNMTGIVEDDLKEAMGVDIQEMLGMYNSFGFKNEDWKVWRLPQGMDVLVPGKFNVTDDGRGGYYLYPEGDTSEAPSGHMPEGGFYFDSIVRQDPIDDDHLDPQDNLQEYGLISQEAIDFYIQDAKTAAATGRCVTANFGGMAVGNIANLPAPHLRHPKGIRDIEEWYISTVLRKDYLHQVFDKQTDIAVENLKKLNAAVGEYVDVIFICGSDFGTQTGPMCSVDSFKELYLPYYKKMNDWIHKNTKWKTLKHSCGAVEPLIPAMIESGFDCLNPVQCSAEGMDPVHLKKEYGRDIVFWGGGVDTQKVLPFGTPEDVRRQVLERCEIFAPDGGFISAAIHCIQANTPVKNIVAMVDAVHEFNGGR